MDKDILSLFLFNKELKFSDIEKKLSARSNKLAYHLKKMLQKGILEKRKDSYSLNWNYEYLIPYFSDKHSPLPVILVHIGDQNRAFLHKREKRPYKDFLSLPGGRLLAGESIKEGAKRIMKDKFNIKISPPQIVSMSLEHIKKGRQTIHSFILILVRAKAKNLPMTGVNKNKSKIIKSDYLLIKSKPKGNLSLSTIISTMY